MSKQWSRRRVLGTLPAIAVAGCSERAGGEVNRDTSTATDTQTPAQTTKTATPEPQPMIDRLPEPSPLETVLEELVVADDRTQFATEQQLSLRDEAVKVELELVEGGEPPRELLEAIDSEYGTMVVAWVHVDSLVDVALASDVRIVRQYSDPKTRDAPQP